MGLISKPQDFIFDVDRAVHNLYCEKRTTIHPMTLVPIYARRMFPGDEFTFGVVEALLYSQPTFGPVLGNWRLRFEWYFDSDANRYGWIDNNARLTTSERMQRRHHTFCVPECVSTESPVGYELVCHRGSLCDYSGIAPGYVPVLGDYEYNDDVLQNEFLNTKYGNVYNLDFILTYLNIIRNYHTNRQFPDVPYIWQSASWIPQYFNYKTFSSSDMDKLFMLLRQCDNGVHFDITQDSLLDFSGYDTIPQYLRNEYRDVILKFKQYLRSSYLADCGGLFCSEYNPDLYQNLLSDSNELKASVTLFPNSLQYKFTVEEFRFANHLQKLYDTLFVSGGRERESSRARWGIKSNRQYDIPEIICSSSHFIGTNLITSNNPGSAQIGDIDYKSVPGDLSGNVNSRVTSNSKQKFTATTGGMLMCIVSLVPIVDYSEDIQRYLLENCFEDEFSPQMARRGFEDVPRSDYSVLPKYAKIDGDPDNIRYRLSDDLSSSIGRQVAWLREMTATNRVHGEFSNDGTLSDWVLKRSFNYSTNSTFNVFQFSPYGFPTDWQYPFVMQTIEDPNWYLQVAIYNKAYRPVGRRFMPTLE